MTIGWLVNQLGGLDKCKNMKITVSPKCWMKPMEPNSLITVDGSTVELLVDDERLEKENEKT